MTPNDKIAAYTFGVIIYLAIAALFFEFLLRGQSPLQRRILRVFAALWPFTLGGFFLYQLGVWIYRLVLRFYVACVCYATPMPLRPENPKVDHPYRNTPTARYIVLPCPICGATDGPCDAGLHS